MRRPLAALTGALAALLPVVASASIGGLSLAPAHPDPASPATRSWFVHALPPGASFSDRVVVANTGSGVLDLLVYAVDGLTTATSGTVYSNRQDRLHSAGAWVTTGVPTLALAPHTTAFVDFTVHVPADAAPGDHVAGIAFEDAKPQTSGSAQLRVTIVARGVVAVLVTVTARPVPAGPPLGGQPSVAASKSSSLQLLVASLTGLGAVAAVLLLARRRRARGVPR